MLTFLRRITPAFEGPPSDACAPTGHPGNRRSRLYPHWPALALVLGSMLPAGCASTGSKGGGLLDQALGVVGLQRSSTVAEAQNAAGERAANERATANPLVTKRVTQRVHAGQVLNVGETGASLPVVLRLYKLKSREGFEQLPYAAFSRTSPADVGNFTADVVETREMIFVPGQRHEVVETLEPQVRFIAVVGLFRSPAPQRWRAIFDTQSAAAQSITLGLHGCALSVAAGQALDMAPELMRVAGVRCEGG